MTPQIQHATGDCQVPAPKKVDQSKSRDQSLQRVNSAGHAELTVSPAEETDIRLFVYQATGVKDEILARQLVSQAAGLQAGVSFQDERERVLSAIGALRELNPENAAEAMLAVQMLGVHNASIVFLMQSTAEGQTVEGTNTNVLRATRLMGLFRDQLELMAKLKGKGGNQGVTVGRVDVHQGGQAIVGAVSQTRERREKLGIDAK